MTNDALVERVSIIAGCGLPEHSRSFGNERDAGDFAACLDENYLTVIAWSDGTLTEIACLATEDPDMPGRALIVMTVMDPRQVKGIWQDGLYNT